MRHASVSGTYHGQSVRPSVIISDFHSVSVSEPHKAPRRHCGGRHGGRQQKKLPDMGSDMVADMEVDKVADKVANMVADKVANMVADMEVDKVRDGKSGRRCRQVCAIFLSWC